jgi:pyruvate dehydrogenase E2 component (dihydrolipoamide acetyltransferase)
MNDTRIHALTMPKWGLSMTEGRISAWLVEEGTGVGPGVEIVDIETEKAASGLEPSARGVLRRKVSQLGEVVPVGGLIAVIAESSVHNEEVDAFIADFRARFVPAAAAEEAAGPAPEMVEVGGFKLRYLLRGGASGLPAILLHGFGSDLNNWRFNHEILASGRPVYAMDLPAHGGSSAVPEFQGLADYVRALGAFMEAKKLDRAHLAGHSMGGAVALSFAAQFPGCVASLTLMSSAGLGEEIDGNYIQGFITASRRRDMRPVLEKLFANRSLVNEGLIEEVLKYKRLDGVVQNLQAVAARFCPGGRQSTVLLDAVARLTGPTMAIWGAEDQVIPVAHTRTLPANVEVHILPETGHMPHTEAASQVNRLLESFWNRTE